MSVTTKANSLPEPVKASKTKTSEQEGNPSSVSSWSYSSKYVRESGKIRRSYQTKGMLFIDLFSLGSVVNTWKGSDSNNFLWHLFNPYRWILWYWQFGPIFGRQDKRHLPFFLAPNLKRVVEFHFYKKTKICVKMEQSAKNKSSCSKEQKTFTVAYKYYRIKSEHGKRAENCARTPSGEVCSHRRVIQDQSKKAIVN